MTDAKRFRKFWEISLHDEPLGPGTWILSGPDAHRIGREFPRMPPAANDTNDCFDAIEVELAVRMREF